jgi:hypothetical protein
MKQLQIVIALSLLAASRTMGEPCPKEQSVPPWLVGLWEQTGDEDGRPFDDTLQFSEDGAMRVFSSNCRSFRPGSVHYYQGYVYVTHMIPGKGPVSVVLSPGSDGKRLTMTSMRTGHNAVYERSRYSACVPASVD